MKTHLIDLYGILLLVVIGWLVLHLNSQTCRGAHDGIATYDSQPEMEQQHDKGHYTSAKKDSFVCQDGVFILASDSNWTKVK